MATSRFWRSLERKFRARQDTYRMLRGDWDSIAGSEGPGNWRLAGAAGSGATIQFVTLAKRAACARPDAGVADPFIAWLEALRLRSRHFTPERAGIEQNDDRSEGAYHQAGTIWKLFEASADYCIELGDQAVEAEKVSEGIAKARSTLQEMERFLTEAKHQQTERVTTRDDGLAPSRTAADTGENGSKRKCRKEEPKFPRRAGWLSERLRERGWNKHDVFRQGGPYYKTVQKIIDGKRVREDVLPKLADALSKAPASKKLPTVNPLEIPQD